MRRAGTFLALLLTTCSYAQLTAFSLKTVAGTQDDLMIVRHMVLRGDNVAIGKKLAEIANKNHGSKLTKFANAKSASDQMNWFEKNYPERIRRAKGVRDYFGVPTNSLFDTTSLPFNMRSTPACSVIYYPGSSVRNGHAMLSRNYDFPKATYVELTGGKPQPGARSMTGDPYVIEMYPTVGYPSLYLCAYDLVAGAIDGVNSKGVSVALLAVDVDNPGKLGRSGYGLSEIDLPRFVLDRCASAKEARNLLKFAPYYADFTPCHYIIGDAGGDSFIFEVDARGRHHIVDGGGSPQIITNHMVSTYGTGNLPSGNSFDRFRRLQQELAKRKSKYTPAEVKEINLCVAVPEQTRVAATLWHSVYDLKTQSLKVSFCLSRADEAKERRTPYLSFKLGK